MNIHIPSSVTVDEKLLAPLGKVRIDPIGARSFLELAQSCVNWQVTDETRRHIGIASDATGRGNSTVAKNLAMALTLLIPGKVLLVDGQLRDAGLSSQFGATSKPGFSDALCDASRLESLIEATNSPQLFFFTAGVRREIAAPRVVSDMKRIVASVSDAYQFVIWDLPPLHDNSPGYVMAQQLNAVISVHNQGPTSSLDATYPLWLRRAVNLGISHLGAVLNQL